MIVRVETNTFDNINFVILWKKAFIPLEVLIFLELLKAKFPDKNFFKTRKLAQVILFVIQFLLKAFCKISLQNFLSKIQYLERFLE